MLNKKLSLAIDAIVKDNFQNQTYSDYTTFDSYLNKTTTLNLVTNTITDKIFDIIYNLVYLGFIPCDSYFDGLIALNTVAYSIIASTNFNVILSQVCLCDSYFNDLITLNTKADNRVFPEYIAYDSDDNKPLTLNTKADNQIFLAGDKLLTLFNIQNLIFSDLSKPLTLNFVTNTVADDAFNI